MLASKEEMPYYRELRNEEIAFGEPHSKKLPYQELRIEKIASGELCSEEMPSGELRSEENALWSAP